MNKRVWILAVAMLLLVCMLAAGVSAEEEVTTVTFAPYTDADGVRQYCACGNKFVADKNGTIAYVNGKDGCKNHKENGAVVDGCDGTLISWSPIGGSGKDLSGNVGKGYYLTAATSLANGNTCNAAGNHYIDLNGNMLYRNNSRVMLMAAGANLYITDTSANKGGTLRCRNVDGTASTDQGKVLWLNGENISVTLFAGGIWAEEPTSYAGGGSAIFCNKSTSKVSVFGGTIKAGTVTRDNAGIAMVDGTFNLYGGEVIGGSGVKGGAIYVGSSATLNISGGTVTGGTASEQGDAIYCGGGQVNLMDGTVQRGTDSEGNYITSCAVVYLGSGGKMALTGGTVDGANGGASAQMGAITLSASGNLTIDGGTVTGTPKSIYTLGGPVNVQSGTLTGQLYINNDAKITVTGGTFNTEIYLAKGSADISGNPKVVGSLNFKDTDQKVTIGTLTEGADVLVKTLGVQDDVIPHYTLSDASALNYMRDNDAVRDLYWIEGEGLYVGKYNCCVCGGVYSGCDHAEKVKYTAVADDLTVINATGNYYLTQGIETASQLAVTENAVIVLDLNGKELSRNARVFALNKAGSLTITDTVGTGAVKSTAAAADNGFVVNVNNAGASLILYSGTLDGSGVTSANNGAAVNVAGTFKMYGGQIIGGTAASYGGAVRVTGENASMEMYGGQVTGGQARYGGAIGLYNKSQAAVNGGEIISGSGTYGTAIYISVGAALTLKDTTIQGGSSGTTIWNTGIITMSGTVSMPSDNFDLMIDARNGESYLDVETLTSTGQTPITVRRWAVDSTDDDPGMIATGADASKAELFAAWKSAYYVSSTENELHLTAFAIQARSGSEALTGYTSWEEAMADTTDGITYYMLTEDVSGGTITRDILLDLNGKHVTGVTIPEGVTLSGMDSTTDDYDCTDGYGTISGTVNGTVATNIKTTAAQTGAVKRYLAVTEDGKISFHRFYMGVTHMNLRPGVTGVGYKALFAGDSVVQQQVESYGFNLWVADGEKHTASKTELTSGATVSLRLQNFDVANYGEADVNATVFMQFANGVSVESDTYSYTLRSLLETINDSVSSFTDTQMSALQTMCEEYADAMSDWDIGSILNWTAADAT